MNIRRKDIRVKDAKNTSTVRVLPIDLRGAVCRDHQKCVIAQALKRKHRAKWVDVGASTVIVSKNGTTGVRYLLDKMAKDQVAHFDDGNGFSPCRVKLFPPPPTQKLGYRRGDRSSGKGGKHPLHRSPPSR